jgi:hypothetical protein
MQYFERYLPKLDLGRLPRPQPFPRYSYGRMHDQKVTSRDRRRSVALHTGWVIVRAARLDVGTDGTGRREVPNIEWNGTARIAEKPEGSLCHGLLLQSAFHRCHHIHRTAWLEPRRHDRLYPLSYQ